MATQLVSLGGTLRERPLQGAAKAEWRNDELALSALQLKWGTAKVTLAGRAGKRLDLKGGVVIGELNELLPQGKGALLGSLQLNGAVATPLLQLSVNGKGLGWQSYHTKRASLDGRIDLSDASPSSLVLHLDGLQRGEQSPVVLALHGSGKLGQHTMTLTLDDDTTQHLAEIKLEGRYEAPHWRGQFKQLGLRPYGKARWQLVAPAALEVSPEQARLDALCLQQQQAHLCLNGEWWNTVGMQAAITIKGLPLQQLNPLLPPRLSADGEIAGQATLQLQPGERLAIDGEFALHEGGFTLFEADGKTTQRQLPLQLATLHLATTGDGALGAEARLSLSDQDYLNASLKLPLQQGWLRPVALQPLQGHAELLLQDLSLLELLQPELRDPQGKLQLDLQLDGTLAEPGARGQLQLIEGRVAVPRLGLQFEKLALKAATQDDERLTLTAAAHSGDGTLRATGTIEHHGRKGAKGWQLLLQVDGDDFEVARIPEARLKVSPRLKLQVEPWLVRIDGRLAIPEARIEPRDITRAVKASEDVVIVDDAESVARQERWRIYTNVELEAPDSIRFIGYGFDGRIGGRLLLLDEPLRLTRGRGELHVVAGSSYTALGQKLQTPRGRLIFADSPVDNPALDIEAQREVGDVVAGVRVGGTARDPALTLYSTPSMDEADILSYLTLGRPLSSAGQSDGQTMMKAANTAGLAGGDYLAGFVGRQFGLEEARLESEGEDAQPWLVIGKYLSPRLYIRYGTALLESGNSVLVRYRLSDNWFLEGESGRNSGGDLIYTFERP
jgi:translocation and assembly module TamB